MQAIASRLGECGLTMHPEKAKIVYCNDSNRTKAYPNAQFTFLGFTFRPRKAQSQQGRRFTSFLPAVSQRGAQADACGSAGVAVVAPKSGDVG